MTSSKNLQLLTSFIVGLLFSCGLAMSGMTQPEKVINFLDLKNWDPSLLFVMIGAICTHAPAYFFIKKKKSPLLESKWHIPTRNDITTRLIIGSALFGIGWGLAGFCPGPAVMSLASTDVRSVYFFIAMIIGMLSHRLVEKYIKLKA